MASPAVAHHIAEADRLLHQAQKLLTVGDQAATAVAMLANTHALLAQIKEGVDGP